MHIWRNDLHIGAHLFNKTRVEIFPCIFYMKGCFFFSNKYIKSIEHFTKVNAKGCLEMGIGIFQMKESVFFFPRSKLVPRLVILRQVHDYHRIQNDNIYRYVYLRLKKWLFIMPIIKKGRLRLTKSINVFGNVLAPAPAVAQVTELFVLSAHRTEQASVSAPKNRTSLMTL